MRTATRLMVVATGLLGMIGCGSDESAVWLHVKNVATEVTTLQVSLSLDGKPATQQYEFAQGLGEVAIRLRKDQIGQGNLSVNLSAFNADRCLLASAKYEAVLSSSGAVSEADVPLLPLVPTLCPNTRPNLVKVPKGTFTMGSPSSENGKGSDEVQHQVTLSSDFWIAESEVTQKQYQNVTGNSPSRIKGDDLPVEQVSFSEAAAYCNALSARENLPPCYQISGTTVGWADKLKCTGYRLPTEAEWEYAANPPNPPRTIYAGSDMVDGVAWYNLTAGTMTHGVKTKTANARGLYDLSGNVWEWVWDFYLLGYETLPSTDPTGPANPSSPTASRVVRGGSWRATASNARVAKRNTAGSASRNDDLGFRIARSIP